LLNGVLFTGMSDENGGLARGSNGYQQLDPAKFPPLQGFHVSHVTSYNNGLYGVYVFNSQHGLVESTYTSGGADSGLYVGQCKPCDIVVRDNVMERNAVGYEQTNAGPDVWVIGNRMTFNRVGATINSNHQEAFLPQVGATLAGNYIASNQYKKTPEQGEGGFGVGIGIGAGTDNLIARNRVESHVSLAIGVASVDDLAASGNRFIENATSDNRVDFVVSSSERSPDTANCLQDNAFETSLPSTALAVMTCPNDKTGIGVGIELPIAKAPRGIPFTEVDTPPQLSGLANPEADLPLWTLDLVPVVQVDEIQLPSTELLREFSSFN
jgi:Periplasmic copper-binding protein (NosD)